MRGRNIFWGVVVLIVGILLMMYNFGWLGNNFWNFLWPVMLVVVGLWILLSPRLIKQSDFREESVYIPVEGATEAEIKLEHGAGRLDVSAGSDPSALISGTAVGGVSQDVERNGSEANVRISSTATVLMGIPALPETRGLHWNLKMNPSLPVKLKVSSGANEAMLDLTGLKVVDLKLETGASSSVIQMPAHAGYTRAKIESGAASVKVIIPQNVAARIRMSTGLVGVNVDTTRFYQQGEWYASADYETAQDKAEIWVESGVGSVDIR